MEAIWQRAELLQSREAGSVSPAGSRLLAGEAIRHRSGRGGELNERLSDLTVCSHRARRVLPEQIHRSIYPPLQEAKQAASHLSGRWKTSSPWERCALPRIRTIKPDFFKHEGLAELPYHTRLAFIGLWTLADRDGRLEDRPRRIKTDVLPYDEIDMNEVLEQLAAGQSLRRYAVADVRVIEMRGFKRHQRISGKEAETPSQYPPPPHEAPEKQPRQPEEAVEEIERFSNVQERKGKERREEGTVEVGGLHPKSETGS